MFSIFLPDAETLVELLMHIQCLSLYFSQPFDPLAINEPSLVDLNRKPSRYERCATRSLPHRSVGKGVPSGGAQVQALPPSGDAFLLATASANADPSLYCAFTLSLLFIYLFTAY